MIAWTPDLIKYWCANYQSLIDYELNPFEELRIWFNEVYKTGSLPHLAPFEETCDMNWSFDQALHKLGKDEASFRQQFIDNDGEENELFYRFVKILQEIDADGD